MLTGLNMANDKRERVGDEAPTWRDLVIVIVAVALLIAISWVTWFKFGWFH